MSHSKLSIGIVGLPNVGKSTLFKALTDSEVDIQNYPFCTIAPNVGIVEVPDERVDVLAKLSGSAKKIPAVIEFVDIAGLVKGAARGEGLGNQFLARVREVDAIAEVVRIFENDKITHVHGSIDPDYDVDVIETELILADLETVKKRLAKDKDNERVEKIKETLESGEPARLVEPIQDLHLLTSKPILYVCNSSEKSVGVPSNISARDHVVLDFKVEEDIKDLAEDERIELMAESRLHELITKAYEMLGLITFFTTGSDETRAWTIKKRATAPEAGAAIHSDFEEKFIRAEVVHYGDLLIAGSRTAARERGTLRIEGKDYVVQDGDVIEFKI